MDRQGSMRPSSSAEDVAAMAVAAVLRSSPGKLGKRGRGGENDGHDGTLKGNDEEEVEKKAPRVKRVAELINGNDETATTIPSEPRNVSPGIRSLLGVHSDLVPGQCHEDDTAEVILVCEPDLHNNIMGVRMECPPPTTTNVFFPFNISPPPSLTALASPDGVCRAQVIRRPSFITNRDGRRGVACVPLRGRRCTRTALYTRSR